MAFFPSTAEVNYGVCFKVYPSLCVEQLSCLMKALGIRLVEGQLSQNLNFRFQLYSIIGIVFSCSISSLLSLYYGSCSRLSRLMVVGHKSVPVPMVLDEDEGNPLYEEVFVEDGILEEYFAYDKT